MGIMNGLNKLRGLVSENLPHLLTAVGVVGIALTAYEAYKAGKKVEQMEEKKPKEVAKALIPTAVTGTLSAAAVISSDIVHTKRYTTLLTSYLIAKAEAPKLKKAAEEIVGKDKVKEITAKVKGEETDEEENERASRVASMPTKTRFKVVDQMTGHVFESTIEQLLKAEQQVDRLTNREGKCTLEEFYASATDSDSVFNAPEIARSIYWDSDTTIDEMDLVIDRAVDDDMVPYLTIEYSMNIGDNRYRRVR